MRWETCVSIFASPASGGRSARRRTETRKGERSGLAYPGKAKVTVAREDDGEVRLGSEPDELEGSRKKS